MDMRIGFLAFAQAHQHLHWIPAALELARRPGIEVDVLCPSRAGIRLIRRYDPERRLRILWTPASLVDGLFDVPPRKRVQVLYAWRFPRYRIIVTTESTSARLRDFPGFRAALVRIRHGVGDAATRLDDDRLKTFDLSLVGGEKDRRRLAAAGLGGESNVVVAGYSKFELLRAPERLFANDRPIALYNPHARPELSSWPRLGEELVRAMEGLPAWNFIVAPHVKLQVGPQVRSSAENVRIDRGSIQSIDMTYTEAASVYIGDASSQVYEFLRTPRPCIFVNAHRVDWRRREDFAHFALGQVIERPEQLGPALARARAVQSQYAPLQRAAMADSIAESSEPASKRQAEAVLALARRSGAHPEEEPRVVTTPSVDARSHLPAAACDAAMPPKQTMGHRFLEADFAAMPRGPGADRVGDPELGQEIHSPGG